MKKFTYYEAEKFLKKEREDLDVSVELLKDLTTAHELSEALDISESTANNWLSERTDISKLGEQAVGYQLMLDLLQAYNKIPESNVVVKKQDTYEIYSENEEGQYELLATANNPKLARTLKEIRKIYAMLKMSANFIRNEIETLESVNDGDIDLSGYKTDYTNLMDLIHYIQDGQTFSEKCENILKKEIDWNFTPDKIINTPELKSDNEDVLNELQSPVLKTYKGQIDTDQIPEGTLIQRIVKNGEKAGEYNLKKINGKIVNLEDGKEYPSINTASMDILEFSENVKETWRFYDEAHNEWKKCKYLPLKK